MSSGHSHHHHHDHAHGHTHAHGSSSALGKARGRLALSVIFTLLFVVGETVAGYLSHSLALLSDAGHNFADVLALVLSWYGLWIADRPSDASRTYGFHRVSILAALANAVSLVLIALLIFWEAISRLRVPAEVAPVPMIVVAAIAVVLNGAIGWALHASASHDLSVRSAYLHMLGDAVSALGVVAAGLIIHFTGSPLADPLVSLLIGALILYSSWSVLTEAVNVLLEASPSGMDMQAVERAIREVDGVLDVHDLHVWSLASGIIAASCHILVSEGSIRTGQQVLAKVVDRLKESFSISHTTVQVEVEGCEPNDMYCTMRRFQSHDHHGH
jgi:cobalt-zinc-cadmium efflux system protein